MLHHAASIFDAQKFKEDIAPVVAALDKCNYKPLLTLVSECQESGVRSGDGEGDEELNASNDVLSRHGSDSLGSMKDYATKKKLHNRDIGKLLVSLLDGYTAPAPSPGANWSVLHGALVSIDWSERDAELLFQGHPAYRLLKPDETKPFPEFLNVDDPYWFWFAPGRAKAGYLDHTEIKSLLSILTDSSKIIDDFDFQDFPGIDASNPTVVREFRRYLRAAFDDTVSMLTLAVNNDMGLYMTLSP